MDPVREGTVEKFFTLGLKDRAQERLKQHAASMPMVADKSPVPLFTELFDLELIQKFQDAFAKASGVGSVILDPSGSPLTRPSNFSPACAKRIFGDEETGCPHLDETSPDEAPHITTCSLTGCMRSGVPIHAGKKLIGHWIIGQILEETSDDTPSTRENDFTNHRIPRNDFKDKIEALHIIAEQLSDMAEQTMRQRAIVRAKQNAEARLQKSEAMLRSIFSAAPIGIGLVTNRILGWTNSRFQEMLGYSEADFFGQSARMLYPNDEEFRRVARLKHPAIKNFGTGSVETRMIGKDGKILDVILSSSRLTPEADESALIFTVQDITQSKQAAKALTDSRTRFQDLFTNMQQGIILLRPNKDGPGYIITDANPAALRIVCKNRDKLMQRPLQWAIPAAGRYGVLHALKRVEKSGVPAHLPECFFKDGVRQGWRDYSIYALATGELVIQFQDVSESVLSDRRIKASLKEKETLLKEIHHRVKNNLQIISSLLRLQASGLKHPNDAEIFIESQNRIRSMALVHEKLYGSQNLSSINFCEYIEAITNYLLTSYAIPTEKVDINIPSSEFLLNVDQAVPLGLLLNELLTNAFKHAFPDEGKGCVDVQLTLDDEGMARFCVADNGCGLPEGVGFDSPPTLGLQLIVTLAEQLNAQMQVDSSQGTEVTLIFPIDY